MCCLELENVAIANALHLEAARRHAVHFLSALISSPVPSLNSLSLSVAVLERFYCWYVTLPSDLDFWPFILNICSRRGSPRSNSVRNLTEIGHSAAELLQFEYLTLWPWTFITCCAMIVCTKFNFTQAIRLWNVTIFDANMSYHAMTLTFDPLTLKLCGRSGVTWS